MSAGTGFFAPREENVMQIGFNAPTTGPLIEPDSLVRIVTEGGAAGLRLRHDQRPHPWCHAILQSKYPYTGTRRVPGRAPRPRGSSS